MEQAIQTRMADSQTTQTQAPQIDGKGIEELRRSPLMAHLLDALDRGEDIGHYGRLVFVMVARHFLDREEIVQLLCKDADCTEDHARGLLDQVEDRDYNPPARQRILEWMERQGFPICPNPEDPRGCNVYRDLSFPEEVYRRISGYHEEKAGASQDGS